MKKFLLFLLFPCIAQSAPFLVSDPDPTGASDKCVYQEGTSPPVETNVVVVSPALTGACHIDLAPFSVGMHDLQVWFKSTLWGVESAKTPFVFVKPIANDTGPSNLRLVP